MSQSAHSAASTSAAQGMAGKSAVTPHSLLEDVVAVVAGTLLISFALALYKQVGILTGGTAGLSFLLHYVSGYSFGALFFVLNLPFYILSIRRMGRSFTLRTFAGVALISVLAELHSRLLHADADAVQYFATVNPFYIAVIGGLIMGVGFIALFRHRTSLGGFNIVALFLQDRYGWRAGWVLMGVDLCIVCCAFFVVAPERVAASVLGVLTINLLIAMNHRPGRYTGA